MRAAAHAAGRRGFPDRDIRLRAGCRLHARAEQRAAGQRERAVIVDGRVHHGIRAVDLDLAAGHVDIIVGVQTVRACVNIQVAARDVDGVLVTALTERAVGGIYAVIRGHYVNIAAVYVHGRALQTLIACGDVDARRTRRGRTLGADHEIVVRVNAVIAGGKRQRTARNRNIGVRVQGVIRAVHGQRAAGDGQGLARLKALAGGGIVRERCRVAAVRLDVKRAARNRQIAVRLHAVPGRVQRQRAARDGHIAERGRVRVLACVRRRLDRIAARRDVQRATGDFQLIIAGQTVIGGVDAQLDLRNRNHRVSCTLDAVFRVAVNGQRARAADGKRRAALDLDRRVLVARAFGVGNRVGRACRRDQGRLGGLVQGNRRTVVIGERQTVQHNGNARDALFDRDRAVIAVAGEHIGARRRDGNVGAVNLIAGVLARSLSGGVG